ncbi:hypothetical protein CEXT_455651 [Caerostris extrusa]|uniref:Uncharacterized protein n=1 Tax=Caerostris extrusa TaxID=172846 RepID=A0AAV4NBI2_CAEEX|nr:hypothetical protein CEXT_455651 [Caerostris extrusa]
MRYTVPQLQSLSFNVNLRNISGQKQGHQSGAQMILLCRTLNQAAPGHLCRGGRRGGGATDLCVRPSISGPFIKYV